MIDGEFVPAGAVIDAVDSDGRRVGFWRCVSSEDRGVWAWHDVKTKEEEKI